MRRYAIALLSLAVVAVAAPGATASPLARNTLYLYNDSGQNLYLAPGTTLQGHWAPDNPPPKLIPGSPANQEAWIEATNAALDDIIVGLTYTTDPSGQAQNSNSFSCETIVPVSGLGDSGYCSSHSSSSLVVQDGPFTHGKDAYWTYTISSQGQLGALAPPAVPVRPAAAVRSGAGLCRAGGSCSMAVRNENSFPVRVQANGVPDPRRRGLAADSPRATAAAFVRIPARSVRRVPLGLTPKTRARLRRAGRIRRLLAHTVTRHQGTVVRRNVRVDVRLRSRSMRRVRLTG